MVNLKPVKPDDKLRLNSLLLYVDEEDRDNVTYEIFRVTSVTTRTLQLICLSDGIFWEPETHTIEPPVWTVEAGKFIEKNHLEYFYHVPREFYKNYETILDQCAKCFRMGVVPKLSVHSYPAVVEMKNENESKE